MALEPQKAHLHRLLGGYDNDKRRAVRKLFAAAPTSPEEQAEQAESSDEGLDIAVGLLEEFYSIGVKEFTIQQGLEALEIFEIKSDEKDLRRILNNPKLRVHLSGDTCAVPGEQHIEGLKAAFCPKEGQEEADQKSDEWRSMSGLQR